MKLFAKGQSPEEPDTPAEVAHTGVRTVEYTGGNRAGANALGVAFYTVVVLSLVLSILAIARPQTTATAGPAQVQGQLTTQQARAGSFAIGYVGAWMSATADNYTGLQQYVDIKSTSDLPAQPATYRDLAVSSTTPTPGSDLVSVIVAANTKEANNKQQEVWPRRYFLVVVNTASAALGVVGMPAPVAGPQAPARGVSLVYSAAITPNDPAAQAIASFLSAYVAGAGDMNRYLSPGSTLTPITPPAFTDAKIQSVQADAAPAAKPKDGQTLRVLVMAQLSTAAGQKMSTTYALTLTSRAGRWEISSLDPTPKESPTTATTPPTSGTTKGN
jgi:hypothetical protein